MKLVVCMVVLAGEILERACHQLNRIQAVRKAAPILAQLFFEDDREQRQRLIAQLRLSGCNGMNIM